MDYENIFNYLNLLNANQEEDKTFYDEIYNFENEGFIPAVRFDVALFLNFISTLKKPKNILEIGFGSGISALFIKKDLNDFENFITLEKDEKRYLRGKSLLNKFNINNIDLTHENSFEFFKNNLVKFDLIFLDAEKTKYDQYILPIKSSLQDGGILITDNVIFNGRVVDKNVEKKYIKGTASIKNYNQMISCDKDFKTIFLNIGDGLSLSIKK
ncbi:MAG TPA: hypothetical protein PK771_02725 [Spirochaetota bacterium]|nr:hypothetical protein [Spirochaetota bacterium]